MGVIKSLFRRRRLEETLDEEIAGHIEMQTEEYISQGYSAEAARRAAVKRFGRVAAVKDGCRDQNGILAVEAFWQDLRFGLRTFASQPVFAAVVLATLALGIGASTAVYSVLHAVLLEPLALPEPDRVVLIWEYDRLRGTNREYASYPDFMDIRESTTHFAHLGAIRSMNTTLTAGGEPEYVYGQRVTPGFFRVLGVEPVVGRVFGPGESGVVLSYGLWQRKFGGLREIVGSTISLDGAVDTVLGVMPPEANGLTLPEPELWASLEVVTADQLRGQHNTQVVGRLRRDATVEAAQAEIDAIMARLENEFPDDNQGRGGTIVELHEQLASTMRPALGAEMVTVVVLLFIASLNIANLMLARNSTRSRELAVRVSLGASRWRVTRQLLTESFVFAAVGTVLGVVLSWWGVRGLIALAPPLIPLVERAEISVPVLLMALVFLVTAWLIFGLPSALRSFPSAGALQVSGRSTIARRMVRFGNALVIAQIALAAVLVVFSGLLIRTFWQLHHTALGYEPQGAIALRINLPDNRYPWPEWPFRQWPSLFAFTDRLKTAASRLPGVEAVSVAMESPAVGSWTTRVTVEGRPEIPAGEQPEAELRTADPDYLKVAGARLVRGRFFDASDDARHPLVAVVNEAFVRRHFPGEDPLGQRIVVFGDVHEVIGIIGDMRYNGPRYEPRPAMYFPFHQAPFPGFVLVARSSGDPALLGPGLRRAVAEADPELAPIAIDTLENTLSYRTSQERFIMALLTGFSVLALVLAAVGIYGIVAFTVGRRLKEMAIRMCFGACGADVFWRLVGGTLRRTLVGVAAGLLIAIPAGSLVRPLLFETSTSDPLTYGVVVSVFLGVAFLGAAIPALRAARVNGADALRQE